MPRMADMIRMLWDGPDHYRSRYFATPAHRDQVRAEHAEIMQAVARGDTDAAAELSRKHRDHALDALCDALPAEDAMPAEEDGELPGTPAKTARRASRR
jgi:DNA-binding GntR family transcriptional regulator